MMIQQTILRRFLSGALLVLFALSITPKKVLHDWIVCHNDGVTHLQKTDAQLNKAGFNCNVQNLVAESPFLADHHNMEIAPLLTHTAPPATVLHQVYTTHCFFFQHRGPPTAC
jgi:hypothetical protein